MSYDSVKNRARYYNKSIWRCYLCAVCSKCYKGIYQHPTAECRNFEGEGKEVTFERGKEWYLKDMHMLRYHQKEMVRQAVQKYLKNEEASLI